MDRLQELRERFPNEPCGARLNARLVRLERGEAVLEADMTIDHSIVEGFIQGGMTTAVADYAGVYAAMTMIAEKHMFWQHGSINFLRPVSIGMRVRAVAHVVNESRRSVLVEVRVMAAEKLCAVATLTFAKP